MDILTILEQFGIPVAVAMAFGFFIWKQNRFIQQTLMTELDQDFKRLEGIIIKLIDQQKLVQMEQHGQLSKSMYRQIIFNLSIFNIFFYNQDPINIYLNN